MSRIHENLPVRQFEQPDSVETAYVCKKSGLLAVDGVCTGDPRGSMAYTEYFAKGTTPTKSCDVHTAVKVCSSTGLLPTATCSTTTKIFVKRPAGSEGTTEDSAYAPPSATCKGHNILDKITNDQIQLIVNTPRGKKGTTDDSYIRKAAIKNRIPYITTMAAAKATVEGIRSAKRDGKLPVQSLQEFHASIIDK